MRKFALQLSFVLIGTILSAEAYSGERYVLSVKDLAPIKGERVIGFEVKLKSASFSSLPKVPLEWRIEINNFLNDDPPWNSSLNGVISVGVAALEPEFFKEFLVIEKLTGKYDGVLDIEIKISTTINFEKETIRTFKMKDLLLTPAGRPKR